MSTLYIPGDLIYFGGERAMVESYARGTDDIYVRVLEKGGENRVWAASLKEEIDGIPLTPEILEANGWEFTECHRDEDGFEWYVFSNDRVSLDLHYYPQCKGFSVFACGEEILPGIKYLHQLQHLLFGLGLESNMIV